MNAHQDRGPTPDAAPSPWMTVAEAAVYARVSEARIKGWVAQRLLAVVPLSGRRADAKRGREDVIIERADLDAFLRGRKRQPATAAVVEEAAPAPAKPRRAAPGGAEEFRARLRGKGGCGGGGDLR